MNNYECSSITSSTAKNLALLPGFTELRELHLWYAYEVFEADDYIQQAEYLCRFAQKCTSLRILGVLAIDGDQDDRYEKIYEVFEENYKNIDKKPPSFCFGKTAYAYRFP